MGVLHKYLDTEIHLSVARELLYSNTVWHTEMPWRSRPPMAASKLEAPPQLLILFSRKLLLTLPQDGLQVGNRR